MLHRQRWRRSSRRRMSSRIVTLQPTVTMASCLRGVPGQGGVWSRCATSVSLDIMWLIGTNLNWADEDDARDSLSGISVSQHSPLTRLGRGASAVRLTGRLNVARHECADRRAWRITPDNRTHRDAGRDDPSGPDATANSQIVTVTNSPDKPLATVAHPNGSSGAFVTVTNEADECVCDLSRIQQRKMPVTVDGQITTAPRSEFAG